MRRALGGLFTLGLLAPWGAACAQGARAATEVKPPRVESSRLKVTQGAVRSVPAGRFQVEGPRLRAVGPGTTTGAVSELRFRYLGPSRVQKALASGESRRQLGLKLRARDGCNVVYVMWRLAPEPGIVVSVKHNPRQRESAECGTHGYSTVRPARQVPVRAPSPGASHVLRAELDGRALRVRVDGGVVWEGTLPPEALGFDGPAGVRTDNVRAELELLTSALEER